MRSAVLSIVAVVGVLAFAAPALGREVPDIVPGRKLWGELQPAERLTVVVRGIEGSQLTVLCKAWKGSALQPELTLVDPAGNAVVIDAFVKRSRRGDKFQIKKLPLARTGRYQLSIEGVFGSIGGFDLTTKAKVPKKYSGTLTVGTPGEDVAVPFDGLAGDVARIVVKKAKRSALSPLIRRLVVESGAETAIDEPKKSPKLPIAESGAHRIDVTGTDGTTGAFTYSLKVKRAKAPKDKPDVRTFHAAGRVTGKIVIEGDVQRSGTVPGAKERRRRSNASRVIAGEIVVSVPSARSDDDVRRALEDQVHGARFRVLRKLTDRGPYLVHARHIARFRDDRRRRRQTLTLAKAAAASPRLEWSEANLLCHAFKEPNDVRWREQYDFQQMNLPSAWDIRTGSSSVVIAIVDTGIVAHPDLDDDVLPGYDFVGNISNSLDGTGWDPDPTDSARDYHGTHVAGTAAASTNNGVGVAGVSWGSKILPVRVLGVNGGSYFDIAAGVRWAAGLDVPGVPKNKNRARVINMSLGGGADISALRGACDAAKAAGSVIVAAAGNSGSSAPSYPAAYGSVISVYALDANLHWASYSNWGTTISVGAPGGDTFVGLSGILSTFVDSGGNPTYKQLQGTSMASPHVAGVAALLLSADPSMTPDGVQLVLEETAIDLGPAEFDVDYGHGMVDAYAALRSVTAPPPAPPTVNVTPSSLEFGRLTDSRKIFVQNLGSGVVTLDAVTPIMDGPGTWLTATPDAGTLPATIDVTVDHDQLVPGTFTGRVEITTSLGLVDVLVNVVRRDPPTMQFVRISAMTRAGRVLAETTTSKADDWEYALENVPLGSYVIVAQADLDADLKIDRVDEFEGEWPIIGRPQDIAIESDDLDHDEINVPLQRVDRRFDFDGVGGGLIDGAIAVRAFDTTTGRPLTGAEVYLGGGGLAEETGSDGRAVIAGSFSGGQFVSVAAPGYETRTRVRANGQYQSFGLTPLSALDTVNVTVTTRGLAVDTRDVFMHVGTTRGHAAVSGETQVDVVVAVPRTAPAFAVSAVGYGLDGRPHLLGLGTVALPPDEATREVTLDLTPPPGGARGRVMDLDLPAGEFTPAGATINSVTELRDVGGRWVPIGFVEVDPDSATTVWWASLIDRVPPLPMRIATAAVDAQGRVSERIFQGHTADVVVLRPYDMPVPGQAQFPTGGTSISPAAVTLTYGATPDANHFDLVVTDTASGVRWRLTASGTPETVALPDLPTGGLVSGRNYSWTVECREIPSFNFGQFLESDLRGETIVRTLSAEALFETR